MTRWKIWFYPGWYAYLFSRPNVRWPERGIRAWIRRVVCRARNHPAGVVWFSSDPNRLEPDMECRNCGEDAS